MEILAKTLSISQLQLVSSTEHYLGVVPGRGFLVDLKVTNPVITENIDHTIINLVQPYFRHITMGMIHMPSNVAF